MNMQNYELKNAGIHVQFNAWLASGGMRRRLEMSWSNWGFGRETLEVSARRLEMNQIRWIELHGNPDAATLDSLVRQTVTYFRAREDALQVFKPLQ